MNTKINQNINTQFKATGPGLSANRILAMCTSCLFITSIALSSYTLFILPLQQEFGLSRAAAALPFTIAMAVWGIAQPFAGILADRYGTRPVIILGILLMAAGYLVMSLAQGFWQVVLGYGVMIGGAISACGTTMFSLLISKHFSAEFRSTAVGISQTASPGNPIIFSPFIYWVINQSDWRSAGFLIAALLLIVALPLSLVGARDPQARVLPESSGEEVEQPGFKGVWAAFKNIVLQKLMLARFACGLGFLLTAQMVPIAISNGYSERQGMLAVAIYGGSAIVWALLGGIAADKIGRPVTLAATYFIRGLGALCLAVPLLAQANEWIFFLLIVLSAGPIFATIAINNVMMFETASPLLAGTILGLSFTIHQVAASLVSYMGGHLFDLFGNYRLILVVVGIISLLMGLLVMTIRRGQADN